jgi:Aromatic-ring hydroxylase, C-terminal
LVRPDGYVAWATDETAPASRDAALHAALTRWCGHPASDTKGDNLVQLRRTHE